jgi:hypothetical protein
MNLIKLADLADLFDKYGMFEQANDIDQILKLAIDNTKLISWIQKQYQRLKQLYSKKKTKEYSEAAGNRLDDMLRQKQNGSMEDKIYLWYCHNYDNSCMECKKRHSRMRTMKQWRQEGLPGTHVCNNMSCTCRLIQLLPNAHMQMDSDGISTSIIGLREDNSTEDMHQGITLDSFFSNYGNLN